MIKLFSIAILFINLIAFVANANNANSLNMDKLPKDVSQLNFKEVGSAQFSVLFWDIYNSTLYTKSGSYSHDASTESLIFEIEYLKDITRDDLLERTIQQWKYLKIPEAGYNKFIPILKTIWPDISSGDKLAMLVKNKQSVFFFNNVRVGHIEQKEFSKLFLDIWLSPNTSQTKLRKQLLGGRG
ncbi:MAG: chalcone isomerase family protein [Colwellia sp.]|nr:chalcone isomerase family protein [Colwellia sp.]